MLLSRYFQPLMKRLRSHIAQLLVVLLICTGLSLSWVQPAQANQSSYAFAQWLSMITHSAGATDLNKQLQQLKNTEGPLEDILKEASIILAKKGKAFDFPFAKEHASWSLYSVLLVEWNQYQSGKAMANIPVQQNLNPLVPFHINKVEGMASGMSGGRHSVLLEYVTLQNTPETTGSPSSILPMSSGIAIGAP